MNTYQKYLNNLFAEFRPTPTYPVYPPYHTGDYLEDFFYKKYESDPHNKYKIDDFYIPVSWTTVYIQNQRAGLQEKLNGLDNSHRYFTVSQHDDAPQECLPRKCRVFSAGGNVRNYQTIPIPLVCSRIPNELIVKTEKKYLASFVGSITHPLRKYMCNTFINNVEFCIKAKSWSPSVGNDDLDDFVKIGQESYFILCPRGYGLNSFRLYESFQLGAVPVIITTTPYLPSLDNIEWSDISVIPENLENLKQTLKNILYSNKYEKMKNLGKQAYEKYFTLEGVYDYILHTIKL